ncbi:hypothetical protein [Streptomyces sp. NPDC001315]|uniref:hypothetical protein n=1 Tax=Streptomyces sp. NPDC001315 TaxID=3364562 RepID=UPI00367C33ED
MRRERIAGPVLAEAETARACDTFVILLFENLARDRLLSEGLAEGRSTAYTGPLLDRPAVQLVNLAERDPALWRRYGEPTLRALRP